jgi:predicted enzyme related to lactoylglutathione lyase
MRFDVYGRLLLDIVRTPDGYQVCEVGAEGKRRLRDDLVLPADVPEAGIEQALDDLLHELGDPGRVIRRVDAKAAPPAGGPSLARHVLTILAVRDLARAAAFYRAAFGWVLRVEAPVYVELELPDGRGLGLYLREAYAKNIRQMPVALVEAEITGTELYFHVDDVDEAVQQLVGAGARMLSPAAARDWGDFAAYLADLDGNVIVVARPL